MTTAPGTFPQYASPIPVQTTHLGHALASEWTKIRTVRSTMWTLGVMLVLVVGLNLLIVAVVGGDPQTDPVLGFGLIGMILGQLCVTTLGVLVVTSEYGTGMIRTTMTACPKRTRVLTAKAIVFFTVTFTVTTVISAVTAVINYSAFAGQDVSTEDGEWVKATVVDGVTTASGTEWLGATVGVGLYVSLLGMLALAVGTLLRHSAGAITAMLGVVFLPLLMAIFISAPGLEKFREKLIEYSAPNALASLYRTPFLGGDAANGVSQLVVLACVTAVALAGAYTVLSSRDV